MGRTYERDNSESYTVAQTAEGAFGVLLVSLIVSAGLGAGAYFLWSASDGGTAIGFVVAAAVPVLLAVWMLVWASLMLVQGIRRTVVIQVNERGITLGPVGVLGRPWFAPWTSVARLKTNTTGTRHYNSSRGSHLSYTSSIEVELTDGTSQLRTAPSDRDDDAEFRIDVINDVVRRVAPHVTIEDTWERPQEHRGTDHLSLLPDDDPFLPGYK